MAAWSTEDAEPVAIDDVECLRETKAAFECTANYAGIKVHFYAPKKLLTPGCKPEPGAIGTVSIPRWLWKRACGEWTKKEPPPEQFETDRVYRRARHRWRFEDQLDAEDGRNTLAAVYLACRKEVLAAELALVEARAQTPRD